MHIERRKYYFIDWTFHVQYSAQTGDSSATHLSMKDLLLLIISELMSMVIIFTFLGSIPVHLGAMQVRCTFNICMPPYN